MTGSLQKGQGLYVGSGGGDAWHGPFGIKDMKECRKRRSARDELPLPAVKRERSERGALPLTPRPPPADVSVTAITRFCRRAIENSATSMGIESTK